MKFVLSLKYNLLTCSVDCNITALTFNYVSVVNSLLTEVDVFADSSKVL